MNISWDSFKVEGDVGWVLKLVWGHHSGDLAGEVVHLITEVVHAFKSDADLLLSEVSLLKVGSFVLACRQLLLEFLGWVSGELVLKVGSIH